MQNSKSTALLSVYNDRNRKFKKSTLKLCNVLYKVYTKDFKT